MKKVKRVSKIKLGFSEKPAGHFSGCDTSWGFGLFWIEKHTFEGGAKFYCLNSYPQSLTIGHCGTSNLNWIEELFERYTTL